MDDFIIEDKTIWRSWATPRTLKATPIHRWLVFPHSYSASLVHQMIDEWGLGPGTKLLDPFVGAGTTVLGAKEMGIPATGYDLMPLSVMAARVKLTDYDPIRLKRSREALSRLVCDLSDGAGFSRDYPDLVRKALPPNVLTRLDRWSRAINQIEGMRERLFCQLALLAIIPEFSHAVATGGWLKMVQPKKGIESLDRCFLDRIDLMIGDVETTPICHGSEWTVDHADARALPDESCTYSAVLTSPPYPNRHDYTRVFGVELMFGFLDWEGVRNVRYQSIESHPESRPQRPDSAEYVEPPELTRALESLSGSGDPRIPRMLRGYFVDMYLCLKEMARVCSTGARIGLVLGNAQYKGIEIKVDELVAEIGEQVGLRCNRVLAIRYRGNSAQQMARFGRTPSRESIVEFWKE